MQIDFQTIQENIKLKVKEIYNWVKVNKIKSLGIVCLSGIVFLILLFVSIYLGAFGRLPTTSELKEIRNPLATTLYSGNNKVIGYFYVQNRSNIDSTQINDFVKHALIATEDVRFYQHKGIDYRSLGRVVVKSILLQDKSSGGGSTITQQLAKNVFGRKNSNKLSLAVHKIREMIIAKRLEAVYSKDDILLLYLNTVPFGEGLYGIEKASKRFFNEKPENLSLTEAATLIGILKATTFYNPRKNPENSRKRRNTVLSQMNKYGYLDEKAYQDAIEEELIIEYTPPTVENSYAAFFKDYLKKEFKEWAIQNPKKDGSLYDIDEDGLKIYTTIHSSIQNSAERAVTRQLERLQKDFNKNWSAIGGNKEFILKLINNHPLYKKLESDSFTTDEIIDSFSYKKERTIWNGTEHKTDQYSLLDSFLLKETTLQGATMVMHTESGKIMAYVGGKDYGYSQFDQLTIPKQVGSTFKPIVYLSALEQGAKPCDYYDNELKTYPKYDNWAPRNADREYGGSYALFGALANSVNTVSVQVMFQAGIDNVITLAKRLGISADLPAVPSLVLGTAEIQPLEMIRAYGSIANGGFSITPYCIEKIEDSHGEVLYKRPWTKRNIIAGSEAIHQLQEMMTYTNTIGTGKRIKNYNIPYNLIGKTGTTQNNADGWYIAATPELVCGSWVGTMNPAINFRTTGLGSGANTALPIVGRVFGDLCQWKTQIIGNFEFEQEGFDCIPKSNLSAEETKELMENQVIPVNRIGKFFQRIFGIRTDDN